MPDKKIFSPVFSNQSADLLGMEWLADAVKGTVEDIDLAYQSLYLNEVDKRWSSVQESVRIAKESAIDKGVPTVLFLPFSSRKEVALRIIALESGIDLKRLRIGDLRVEEWPVVTAACGKIQNAPLLIDESRQFLNDIGQRLRVLKKKIGIRLGIIDRFNAMLSFEERSKMQEDFQRLSKEIGIRIVIVDSGRSQA